MNLDELQAYCTSFPGVVEDIKWGHDLCFCVGGKMFCVTGLSHPVRASLKVRPEQYAELTERSGIVPAPYMARNYWVLVEDPDAFTQDEWKKYIAQSYELVRAKLPKKVQLLLTHNG